MFIYRINYCIVIMSYFFLHGYFSHVLQINVIERC